MTDIATTETILPPIGQHVGDMTRALIERKVNGTEERAQIKFGNKHFWAELAAWTTWSVPMLFAGAIATTILFSM